MPRRLRHPQGAGASEPTFATYVHMQQRTLHIRGQEATPVQYVSLTGDDDFNGRWDRPKLTLAAAQTAVAVGGTILLGPQSFSLPSGGLILSKSGVTWRGTGMYSSIIRQANSGSFILAPTTTRVENVTFEDLAFDGADVINNFTNLSGVYASRLTFRRVRFTGMQGQTSGYALRLLRAIGWTVEDCLFEARGTGNGRCILIQDGGREHTIRRNKFRWVYTAVSIDTGTDSSQEEDVADAITIEGNDVEMGWWLLRKETFSGSGGTVTYGASSLTDTGAAFTGINTGGPTHVRAMPVLESGSITTLESKELEDPGATFVTNLVQRGHIVRATDGTTTKVAFVEGVESETKLRIEEWLLNSDYSPTLPPAATGWTYIVYGILLARIASFTGTILTLTEGWHDLDGAAVTPSAGTLYEVLYDAPNYPVLCEMGTRARIRNNRIRRSFTDAITLGGSWDAHVDGNDIEEGQDMGITLDTGSAGALVTNNRIRRQAVGGIWVEGSHHLVSGNLVEDSTWGGKTLTSMGDIALSAALDCQVVGNKCRRIDTGLTKSLYGISLRNVSLRNLVADNYCSGHATAGIRFDDTASDFNVLRDNEATISVNGTLGAGNDFGTIDGTGTPEAAVVAPVGTIFRRGDGTTGTAAYVKETGVGNTGWVAVGSETWRLAVRKTADETVNNSTTIQNDNHLLWAVAANEVWFAEALLVFSSSAVADLKVGWSVPAATTMKWGRPTSMGNAGLGSVPIALENESGVLGYGGIAGAADVGITIAALVTVGANAGNVNLQWAQSTAEATDTIVRANSLLRLTRLV